MALAKKADTVLLCLGLDELRESEGLDRSDMKLAENQQQLLALWLPSTRTSSFC